MPEKTGVPGRQEMTAKMTCVRFSGRGWESASVHVPSEIELTIYVNQQELVTVLCTPTGLPNLVLGFLYAEEIIQSPDDVLLMRVCQDDSLADVRLKNPGYKLSRQRTLTSGCGGGATFATRGHKVESSLVVAPAAVLALMRRLQERMELYRLSGGVHTSALSDTNDLLVLAEDIGRHNTLDKIQGECLARGLETKDRLLLTTGRVSSEMLRKAARMQVPVIVSRHTPTAGAVALAHDLGVALVGARGGRLLVYAHPVRLGCQAEQIRDGQPPTTK